LKIRISDRERTNEVKFLTFHSSFIPSLLLVNPSINWSFSIPTLDSNFCFIIFSPLKIFRLYCIIDMNFGLGSCCYSLVPIFDFVKKQILGVLPNPGNCILYMHSFNTVENKCYLRLCVSNSIFELHLLASNTLYMSMHQLFVTWQMPEAKSQIMMLDCLCSE